MQTSASSKVINENVILKNYEKKVKEEVRLINENLFEMLKLLKIDDSSKVNLFLIVYLIFLFKKFIRLKFFRAMMIWA